MILHVDMDAFFASIEQAINPRLRGKPLIVGSRASKMHTVVCAASYEAKTYGIKSGMLSAEAFRICRNLQFIPADQSKYIWTSEQIFSMLKAYGLQMEYASIDEFRMDIANTPESGRLAESIQKQIRETFNITASIGIAKNCLLAKLASKLNKPNGIYIITEDNLTQTLGKTQVEKLCGVGHATEQAFSILGVETCLELYQKSPGFLERHLGKNGLNLYIGLHSKDAFSDSEEEEIPKSVGHSYTLPAATKNPVFIRAWVRLLSEMVGRRLRQDNLTAKAVHLWLNGPEIGNFVAQKTFQQETADSFEIYRRGLKIMAKFAKNMPQIRALGVSCSGLQETRYQMLFKEEIKREALLETMDSINNRFGDGTIYPAIISFARQTR